MSESIGIGNYNPNTGVMTFGRYQMNSGEMNTIKSFQFDNAAYGTPTGIEWINVNGQQRALVTTQEQKDSFFTSEKNYVLDMNAMTGQIEQYFTTPGHTNKLKDVLYEDGKIILGHQRSGTGFIQVGA